MSGKRIKRGKGRILRGKHSKAVQPPQKRAKLNARVQKLYRLIDDFYKSSIPALIIFIISVGGFVGSLVRNSMEAKRKQTYETHNSYKLAAAIGAEIHGSGTVELLSSDPKEPRVYAVDLAMYCQLMNIGLNPIQIVSYSIAVKSQGRWIDFIHIPIQQPRYLVRHSQANPQPQYVDVSNRSLNNILLSSALAPGESRGGWMFLKLETNNNRNFIIEELRITAFDITGRVYTIFPKLITESQYNELRDNFSQQYGMLRRASMRRTRY
ncbi:MAG TPA: hypothetical protein VLR90_08930 [Blastocatellia bacterium]|nr:hypothetical protein [Blastocatellia bacterium]